MIDREYRIFWVICSASNLVLPLMSASEEGFAWSIGMFLGLLILGFMGFAFCTLLPGFCKWFAGGTMVVAVGQFFPVAQLASAMWGLEVAAQCFGPPNSHYPAEEYWPEGLLMTLVAGGIIGLLALIIGLILRSAAGLWNRLNLKSHR